MVLDILRKQDKPLSSSDLTLEIMVKKGFNIEDDKLIRRVQCTVTGTIKRQNTAKLVKNTYFKNQYYWQIA